MGIGCGRVGIDINVEQANEAYLKSLDLKSCLSQQPIYVVEDKNALQSWSRMICQRCDQEDYIVECSKKNYEELL